MVRVDGIAIKTIEDDARALAKQFALLPSEAHDMLVNEIHHLEQLARIQDFVPLLALKHVKDHLRDTPNDLLTYGLA